MPFTIRTSVFETNSSSTHSFTIGYGAVLDTIYFKLNNKEVTPKDEEDDEDYREKENIIDVLYHDEFPKGISAQEIGEGDYELKCLIYVKAISSSELNKTGKIPEITPEDIAKLDKTLELLGQEKQEYKWHTAEYFCSMC